MQGPEYVKLLRRSYDLFLDLQQRTGQVGCGDRAMSGALSPFLRRLHSRWVG